MSLPVRAADGAADEHRPAPARQRLQRAELRAVAAKVLGFAPGAAVPALAALASTMVFTRVFDAAEFGRFSLVVAAVALLTALGTQWLQQGAGRYLPGAGAARLPALKAAVGSFLLLMVMVIAGLAIPATMLLATLLPPVWTPLLRPAGLLLLGAVLLEPLGVVLQSAMRGMRYSVYKAADATLRFFIGLAAVLWIERSAGALLWGMAAGSLLLAPVLWRDAQLPPLRVILRVDATRRRDMRAILGYGLPLVLWFAASYLLSVGDRYILQLVRGPAEVGIYAANYSLAAGAGGVLAAPVLLAAHPWLMRAWDSGDRERAERWVSRLLEFFILGGVIMVGLLALASRGVAGLLLGSDFHQGHLVIPITMAGVMIWQLSMFVQKPLEFTGRIRVMLWGGLAAAGFNVAANLLLIPRFGYLAAAATTVLSYLLYALVVGLAGRGLLHWRVRWRLLLTASAVLSATFTLVAALRDAAAS